MLAPTLPLPAPLLANERGTFTEDSVVRRLPEIARRTIAENQLDERRTDLVEKLADEIPDATLTPIDESEAPDAADWLTYVEPFLDTNWLDTPWFLVETYFYRRLLAATGYSHPGDRRGVDPFGDQKRIGLDGAMDLAENLGATLEDPRLLLRASLWANRVDLSLWPAGEAASDQRTREVLTAESGDQMLVDDTDAVVELLAAPAAAVHIVLDNAGAELVADLALAASVLNRDGSVVFHAKPHPTFVSDATPADLATTIQRLAEQDSPARTIAEVLLAAQSGGKMRISAHPFWVSPLAFWECPPDLEEHLSHADLIVVKGDANYRRLLGNRHWHPTTPISRIIRPPAPLVALRTAKAEVAAGLTPSGLDRTRATDPDWMVNGQWGMVQFAAAAS